MLQDRLYICLEIKVVPFSGELLITEARWRAGCPPVWLWQWPCRRDNVSIALRCSSHIPGSSGAASSASSSRPWSLASIGESPVSPHSPLGPLNLLPTCYPNVISVCLPTLDCWSPAVKYWYSYQWCEAEQLSQYFYFPVFLKGITKYFHKCSLAFSS